MDRANHRIAVIAASAALAAVGVLTACSPTTEKEAPATSSASSSVTSSPSASTPASAPASSAAPTASPTEKAIGPGGNESFSPTIDPTPPGAVCKEVVNGVCIR